MAADLFGIDGDQLPVAEMLRRMGVLPGMAGIPGAGARTPPFLPGTGIVTPPETDPGFEAGGQGRAALERGRQDLANRGLSVTGAQPTPRARPALSVAGVPPAAPQPKLSVTGAPPAAAGPRLSVTGAPEADATAQLARQGVDISQAPARLHPALDAYEAFLKQPMKLSTDPEFQAAPLHGWKKALSILEPAAVGALAGLGGHPEVGVELADTIRQRREEEEGKKYEQYQQGYYQQGLRLGKGVEAEERGARLEHEEAGTALDRERLAQLKQNPEDKFLFHDVDAQGNSVAVFQGADGAYTKPVGYQVGGKSFTNPFEAFAYGTSDERGTAREFLDLEKRLGAKYRNPGEVEQRYTLYQRDPEAYKAMFGDRGGAADQTQAARMLKYFDSRRKEVENDFTLDDATKQQRLAEIDDLERPYLDAVGAGRARGNGNVGNQAARGHKVGDVVSYKGQQMRVKGVRRDGKLELEAIGGGQK